MFSQKPHLVPKGEARATYGNAAIIPKTERSKPFPTEVRNVVRINRNGRKTGSFAGRAEPVPYQGSETWFNKTDTWKRFGRFTPSPMFSQKTHLIPKGEALATYGNAAIILKTERSKPAADGPPFPT